MGPVENVSTGRPNVIVMLKTMAAMKKVKVDWGKLTAYFAGGDAQRGIYLLTEETLGAGYAVHARKLTPRREDPATGSAAGCAAAYLVKHGVVRSGEVVKVEQGHLMGRPSELLLSAVKGAGGEVDEVRVGGGVCWCSKERWWQRDEGDCCGSNDLGGSVGAAVRGAGGCAADAADARGLPE